ncbi:MAG: 30S ribosomal protein S18 [Rhodothermia bacterium]|nr:30S ribosomal protein S18 [Rhodothermia bacterium]
MARRTEKNNTRTNTGLAPLNSNTPVTQPRQKRKNRLGEIEFVDYKNVELLQRFINDQGKLLPRRITGVTAKQQRAVVEAVKRARQMALLPYVADNLS